LLSLLGIFGFRLAFDGDCEGLKKALVECSEEDKTRLDTQGNTVNFDSIYDLGFRFYLGFAYCDLEK